MSAAPTLYDFELDDECYKVRLAFSLMGIAVTRRKVDVLPGLEPESSGLRALNPFGRVPILVDGDIVVHDAQAIIAYGAQALADDPAWLPRAPAEFGAVMAWLFAAARELSACGAARRHAMQDGAYPDPSLVRAARQALLTLEDHLVRRGFAGRAWLVGDRPSIAEPVIFPSFMLSRDFGLEHDEFPALRRWARHVRALPGFIVMPGIPAFG